LCEIRKRKVDGLIETNFVESSKEDYISQRAALPVMMMMMMMRRRRRRKEEWYARKSIYMYIWVYHHLSSSPLCLEFLLFFIFQMHLLP
jgi:hypothetical protein